MASGLTPVYGPSCRRSNHVPVTVFGTTIPFDRRAANQLLRAAIKAYGVPYRVYRIESYNCRRSTSGSSMSAHSWAVAVDINPDKNPFTRGRLITDMPREFVQCFKSEGFGWGGDWRSCKDAMHFSLAPNEGGKPRPSRFDRKLQQRAIEAWLARNNGVNIVPDGGPRPVKKGVNAPSFPGFDMDRKRFGRKTEDAVRRFQQRLRERGWRVKASGRFDSETEQVVKAFQREKRLFVDGVVGKNTWRLLWEADIT